MAQERAFQDRVPDNHCWGCGPEVENGLRVKSYWSGDETVCDWMPRREFAAGPRHILYGGIISAIIDCHTIWTAIAATYRRDGREVGEGPGIWYVTGSLRVSYRKPTPIDQPLTLRGRIKELGDKKATVVCSLVSAGEECATGETIAVRAPGDWFGPRRH